MANHYLSIYPINFKRFVRSERYWKRFETSVWVRFSITWSSQIYDVVQRQDSINEADPHERRYSTFKRIQSIEENNPNETRLEFSAVTYAILEHEQKVDVVVKRMGPIDQICRFRCLIYENNILWFALAHLNLHDIAIIENDPVQHYLLSSHLLLLLLQFFFLYFRLHSIPTVSSSNSCSLVKTKSDWFRFINEQWNLSRPMETCRLIIKIPQAKESLLK